MHMADGLVSPQVAGTMFVASGLIAGYSIHKLRKEENLNKKIPLMGIMGAFVFATQMINFTIPGTGSSGHLCGGMLLSSILGPYAGFLSMIGVLLIQCLFFADGGLLAFGANVWNMAFYGCFIGAFIWKFINRNGISKRKIIISSMIASIFTLQLGALSVTIETLLSGITELPFVTFVGVMLPIHLAIGTVEGIITSAVLCFVYEARPELLWNSEKSSEKQGKISYKKTLAILICLFVVIAGVISLFASSYPDGLEWSISKLTGDTEIETEENDIYETTSKIQETTSILPDYNFESSESNIGTSISGIVGCIITVAILIIIGYIIKVSKKINNKKELQNNE